MAAVFSFAYPMQVNGWNQNAHYALVRAFADGTPTIDRTRFEIGDLGTGDVTRYRGHTYSNKAPGLAGVTLPAFFVADSVMRTTGDPTRVIWALHLWSIVVAAAVLLVLVRRVANRLAPGYGTTASIALGLGTFVLPFSTLFFAHVLAAAFAFAAFALLFAERSDARRLELVAAGGVLAGLGITTDYFVLFAAVILGLYALWRHDPLRRAAVYAGGVLVGIVPLLLYNQWAYGSIAHFSYEQNQVERLKGFFGLGWPKLSALHDLLFSAWGIVTLTPVVVCGLVGAVVLFRGGRRAEALVLSSVPLVQLVFDSSITFSPFGGLGFPRYLITALPFAAVPLAVAFRTFPVTTLVLACVSGLQMTIITATNPLAAYDGDWLHRSASRVFSSTGASIVGITGWYAIAPFFVAVALAAGGAALATHARRPSRWEMAAAPAALVIWAFIALGASNPNGRGFARSYVVVLIVVLSLLAVFGTHVWTRRRPRVSGGRAVVGGLEP